jgi:hypothetical protein
VIAIDKLLYILYSKQQNTTTTTTNTTTNNTNNNNKCDIDNIKRFIEDLLNLYSLYSPMETIYHLVTKCYSNNSNNNAMLTNGNISCSSSGINAVYENIMHKIISDQLCSIYNYIHILFHHKYSINHKFTTTNNSNNKCYITDYFISFYHIHNNYINKLTKNNINHLSLDIHSSNIFPSNIINGTTTSKLYNCIHKDILLTGILPQSLYIYYYILYLIIHITNINYIFKFIFQTMYVNSYYNKDIIDCYITTIFLEFYYYMITNTSLYIQLLNNSGISGTNTTTTTTTIPISTTIDMYINTLLSYINTNSSNSKFHDTSSNLSEINLSTKLEEIERSIISKYFSNMTDYNRWLSRFDL